MPEMTIAWQGGEPTLMGVDFFRRAVACAERFKKPGTAVRNALQTDGTLLDDEGGEFFRQNGFLVGISLDGPRSHHDAYRVGRWGGPTFDRVMGGLECLKRHRVEFNILYAVHTANGHHPLEVYHFFRDEVAAQFLQFIPIAERQEGDHRRSGTPRVSGRSVQPEREGGFLIGPFDEWVRRDMGRVFVQVFDAALANSCGVPAGMCVWSPACGLALALEHNGDLCACDHFVDPGHRLGNIQDVPLIDLVASERQVRFGRDKRDTLPRTCLACEVRLACHGECPKNRFLLTPEGEAGLNYLCAGYKAFFQHIDRPMRLMAGSCARAGAGKRDGAPADDRSPACGVPLVRCPYSIAPTIATATCVTAP